MITNGRLINVYQTLSNYVNDFRTPLLGIPLSNDQKSNLFDAENRGIAHVIPWKGLSNDTFFAGIQTVLHDDNNMYVYIL